jgi:hypothetical protein
MAAITAIMLIMFATTAMFIARARRVLMMNPTFGGWMEFTIFRSH